MENFKQHLSFLIHNTKEPLILRQHLNWDVFSWDISKWNEVLKDEKLQFRCGLNSKTRTPQWERSTEMINGKFDDLLGLSDSQKWLYFDYKYLNQCLLNATELRENIDFKDLGLGNVDVVDSTIWIGSKGAHTPCHIDTYGCNVVVQVYGKKLWLLFPLEQDLKSTRVPYEESSIYSKLNFFSPNQLSDFKDISNCRAVTLNPGDVLIVPNKWWHYVENLELSISINTWLPLPQDDDERQKECLVQTLMACFTKYLNKNKLDAILNPNSEEEVLQTNLGSGIELLNKILNNSSLKKATTDKPKEMDIDQLMKQYKILKISTSSSEEFKSFLEKQSNRFSKNLIEYEEEDEVNVEKLIHAITHPEVVELIMKILVE